MNDQHITQAQRDEFEQLVADRVKAIVLTLTGDKHSIFVVLEALVRVHRSVASQLDNECKGHVAMALGEYAGEMLRTSAAPEANPVHH